MKRLPLLLSAAALVAVLAAAPTSANPSAKFFSYFDDGCEHPEIACQSRDELPANLSKKEEFSCAPAYAGTVQRAFADENAAGIDAFEHYFTNQNACEQALAQQNCEG